MRGKSANLPAITEKDWLDLKFGIDVGVDYYALSFVRNADVIYELKRYLAKQGAQRPARRHCNSWCIAAAGCSDVIQDTTYQANGGEYVKLCW